MQSSFRRILTSSASARSHSVASQLWKNSTLINPSLQCTRNVYLKKHEADTDIKSFTMVGTKILYYR